MRPRFSVIPLVLTAGILIIAGIPASTVGESVGSRSCDAATGLRPVTIEVPANGVVSFGIDDLVRASADIDACYEQASISATLLTERRDEGELSVAMARRFTSRGWATPFAGHPEPRFVFKPRSRFSGASRGWELGLYSADGQWTPSARLGTVVVNFQVRNALPVAMDDEVRVTAGAGELDVPALQGLLVNDTDVNGDQVIVHSVGITGFPWGAVEIRRDGSYRVIVTDPGLVASDQLRYVVWDQQGSPTSMDYGILTITFDAPRTIDAYRAHHIPKGQSGAQPAAGATP